SLIAVNKKAWQYFNCYYYVSYIIALMHLHFLTMNAIFSHHIDLLIVQAYSSAVVANSATRFDSLNTCADNRRFPILRYFCVRKTALRPNYGGA
ncbi:TPA: hypothetical protein ACIYNM_005271, partial [Escherichia coli]